MEEKQTAKRGEESKWNPAHWSEKKVKRFTMHVIKNAQWTACAMLGEYEGNKVCASIVQDFAAQKSAALLALAGVKTIGEVERGTA